MPPRITTVSVTGSGVRTTLTDIQPGRTRPINYPLSGTPFAVAWPLIAAAITGVTAYAWGRNSKASEAAGAAKSASLDATINKLWGQAQKETAEAEAITKAANDPRGLSRELAENIARRKIGLEEQTAEIVQAQFAEEADFRRSNRDAVERINNARIRQVAAEADQREAAAEETYQRSLTAAERSRLEVDKLYTQNQLLEEVLAGVRRTRELAEEKVLGIPERIPPIGRFSYIGPGVEGGIR